MLIAFKMIPDYIIFIIILINIKEIIDGKINVKNLFI